MARHTTNRGVTKRQSRFAQVPTANIQRSTFDRSFALKTTFNSGFLVPIFVDEVLPGDTFNLRMQTFARMATPLHPVMDNLYCEFFFFFVPNRLVWDNWEKFNGSQDKPGDSTDFQVPQVNAPMPGDKWTALTNGDYFGLPTEVDVKANALPFRALHLIWNEWFRDENLQDPVVVNTTDGPDNGEWYGNYGAGDFLLRRGKRHDYFTSCLPFPQKGAAVTLPLGNSAPVITTNDHVRISYENQTDQRIDVRATGGLNAETNPASGDWMRFGSTTGLQTDLTQATAATINQIRESFQIQRLFERDARGGTRYTEILLSHFGVVSPDQRLQRPEYLGGGRKVMQVNPVAANTGASAQSQALGDLAAFVTGASMGIGFTKSFVEHGFVIGLASIRADLHYQQGLERMWSRRDRFEYFWPALAHLGEQPVLNQEIFAQGTPDDEAVFGYQERWAEYRYKPSRITGAFRSNTPGGSLDTWHFAQDFQTLPLLNDEFIRDQPPVERAMAVPSQPQFLFDAFFSYRCARPMPTYSVPGLIDHF